VSLTWLTPWAAIVVAGVLAPVAATLIGRSRAGRVRDALGVQSAPPDVLSLALVALIPALLALAATQPALIRRSPQHQRTDAAVFVVVDVSRSMLASAHPGAPTRLERARVAAVRIRAGLPEVPVGLASLTDRALPLLLPTADQATFDSTVRGALRIESPPPLEIEPNATSFNALAALGTQGFFAKAIRHRVVILLTDGESQSIDVPAVSAALAGTPVIALQIWSANERVYDRGVAEPAYRPDPAAATLVRDLAGASGGQAFRAGQDSAAARAVRRLLGRGPSRVEGETIQLTPLAPWIAGVALLPLVLLLVRRWLAGL
jgi:hypothetical protein